MLEAAETGSKVSKEAYEAEVPQLRIDLLNAQFDLGKADFPLIVLVAGDDGPGCEDVVDRLHEWFDARHVRTHFFGDPTDEEQERPRFWRYWRALPREGQVGVFVGGWALNAIAERLRDEIGNNAYGRRIEHIRQFEDGLVNGGALMLKFWLHLPRKQHKRRLRQAKKHPDRAWRIEKGDELVYERYRELRPIAERFLRKTSTAAAPWHVIESTDRRYRNLTVARAICAALTARLASDNHAAVPVASAIVAPTNEGVQLLQNIDLSGALKRSEYRQRRDRLQAKLARLSRKARRKGLSSTLVFEGWDAGGKGGAIRRLTAAMSARDYRIVPIAAPTQEEKEHHYLWRFWRELPRAGRMLIWDRSWYGRVMVERIEGFAREDEWRRAYEEINDFERQLVEHGMPVLKFWLQIDPDEQLRRFQAREQTPYKKHKMTEEDYRNRNRWDDYAAAVGEMVARTSTELAPWTIVAANDKRSARIKVLETVCQRLADALKGRKNKRRR